MSLNRFRVITFDVVGTLIDFERGMINFIRDVDQKTAERLGDEHILNYYRHRRGNKPSKWFPDDLVRVCLAMAPDLGRPRSLTVFVTRSSDGRHSRIEAAAPAISSRCHD
jgi:putative hydrolase of the HAD superfamily